MSFDSSISGPVLARQIAILIESGLPNPNAGKRDPRRRDVDRDPA